MPHKKTFSCLPMMSCTATVQASSRDYVIPDVVEVCFCTQDDGKVSPEKGHSLREPRARVQRPDTINQFQGDACPGRQPFRQCRDCLRDSCEEG